MSHDYKPFDDGFSSKLLGSLKIYDFRNEADQPDQ
jgi:hypothetical protein